MTAPASTKMNALIRRAAGRPVPEPEEPASPNGRGDGGKHSPDPDEVRSPSEAMNAALRRAIRGRAAA